MKWHQKKKIYINFFGFRFWKKVLKLKLPSVTSLEQYTANRNKKRGIRKNKEVKNKERETERKIRKKSILTKTKEDQKSKKC